MGSTVFKAFDYRNRDVAMNKRRSPALSTKDFCLISYPKIEGGHIPVFAKHVVDIAKELLVMFNDGFVHGDLRLANMIFPESRDKPARIIDFDCSNTIGAFYTIKLADVPDTKRHSDLIGNSLQKKMKISHDIYSFVQICNFFELSNDIADWSSIRNVKTRDQLSIWINAVEKECSNTNLICEPFILEQLNKAFGFRETNSPP